MPARFLPLFIYPRPRRRRQYWGPSLWGLFSFLLLYYRPRESEEQANPLQTTLCSSPPIAYATPPRGVAANLLAIAIEVAG